MTTNNSAMNTNDTESAPTKTCESKTTVPPNNTANDQKPATCGEVKNAAKEIKEVLEQCQNQTKEGLHEINEFFRTEFQKCVNETKGGLTQVKESLKTEIKECVNKTKEGLNKMKNVLRTEIANCQDETNRGLNEMKEFSGTQFEKCESRLKDGFFRSGVFNMLMTLKILLMIAVIVFFSTNAHVSEVKPCELKRALDSLYLSYTFDPCKHSAIRGISGQLSTWGIVELSINSITSLFIIFYICNSRLEGKMKHATWINVLFLLVSLCALTFFAANLKMYIDFEQKQKEYAPIRSGELQTVLLSWLANHYKTDNITNSDAISKGWNILFIKYDCCAVREVQGTTNDFDTTPWCTTSGSCQATASQIPKTCCKDVTQDDYQNAPSTCHASVNQGTFRRGCIGRLNALNNDGVEEWQVCLISTSLLTMLVLQIFEVIIAIGLLLFGVIKFKRQQTADNT